MPTDGDIGWCAGLFEGEGTVVWIYTNDGTQGHLEFKINQADSPEILNRFKDIMGGGSVTGPYGPYKNSATKRPMYVYQSFQVPLIRAMFKVMRDNLSVRRIIQFELALERSAEHQRDLVERNKTCRAGTHPKNGPGTCFPCKQEYHKTYNKTYVRKDEDED
jgi:hypothetical protein